MRNYESFIFESYDFNRAKGEITLTYSLDDDIRFTERLQLPRDGTKDVSEELLDRALFGLHLIGGISYFKTCIPKNIEIRSGKLTNEQADFWNTVYEKGLGEFFYKNNIDFRGLINFPAEEKNQKNNEPIARELTGKTLVPIGGGKDSIVTIELLRKEGLDMTLFRMGSHPLIEKCAEIAKLPLLNVERELDPLLFKLNEEGALNGHVPISAYLSWLTVVTSFLYGYDTIVMSNERSASFGNTEFHGMEVNHQWSKSEEFERLFSEYISAYLTPHISYFSLLRPFTELKITQIFCDHTKYFPIATSCNTNWKITQSSKLKAQSSLWCNQCPKCAFVFALFSAFLPKKELLNIFGRNLFNEDQLLETYKELLGLTNIKPFECVGTPEEMKAAMLMAYKRGDLNDALAMLLFKRDVLPSLHAHQ